MDPSPRHAALRPLTLAEAKQHLPALPAPCPDTGVAELRMHVTGTSEIIRSVDAEQMSQTMDEVLDQAVVFHGYAAYMRDYDIYLYAIADPCTGIEPEHLRYRFVHAVEVSASSAVRPEVWKRSLDDRLTSFETGVELEGFVWAVNWQLLYPGMRLVTPSPAATRWNDALGIPFFEARIETNVHDLTIVFSDLRVERVLPGYTPFAVPHSGPDAKIPLA